MSMGKPRVPRLPHNCIISKTSSTDAATDQHRMGNSERTIGRVHECVQARMFGLAVGEVKGTPHLQRTVRRGRPARHPRW